MEYLTYNKLHKIIKEQYPIVKTTGTEATASGLWDFYKDPNLDKIKSAFVAAVEPEQENKDDIDNYVYFSKNYI